MYTDSAMSLTNNSTIWPTLRLGTCSVNVYHSVIAIGIISAVYIIFGVSGNLYAVHALWSRTKPMDRKRGQKLYTLIAVVDIVFIVIITPWLAWRYVGRNYLEIACGGLTILMSMFITVSQGCFLLVSIERYRCVANPFKLELGKEVKGGFILTSICISLAITVPTILKSGCYCWERCLEQKCLGKAGSGSSLLISATVHLFIAVIICVMIWSLVLTAIKLLFKEEGFVTKRIIASRKRTFKRSLRMLFLNLISLMVCTLPYNIFSFATNLYIYTNDHLTGSWIVRQAAHVWIYFECLLMALILIKPVIYLGIYEDCDKERDMIRKVFCPRQLGKSSKDVVSSDPSLFKLKQFKKFDNVTPSASSSAVSVVL